MGGGGAITVGTNAFEEASVTTGASSAEFGGSQSGVISIATRTGGSQFSGSVGYESDELSGTASSLGFNRVTASLGGPIVSNLTFFVSGVLEGQKSNGSGLDRADSPIFVSAGLGETVAVPTVPGDPTSDTSFVDIANFAVYTGKCDEAMQYNPVDGSTVNVSQSANPDIASNYGVDCQGVRIPTTTSSAYQLQGKLNFSFGTGSRISFTALGSQAQGRIFSYANLYNPQALFGSRGWNQVYTLNWTQNLAKSSERALALDVSGSYQTNKFVQSPLTAESELDSRDAFGGFLITPLKFRWDFDNFPLNEELERTSGRTRRAHAARRTTSRTRRSTCCRTSGGTTPTACSASPRAAARPAGCSSTTRPAGSAGRRSTGRSTGTTASRSAAATPTSISSPIRPR